MLKDRSGPYPRPPRDTSKIPDFHFSDPVSAPKTGPTESKPWSFPSIQKPSQEQAVELPVQELCASPKNAFRRLDDDTYAELKASLQANGLVYPIIVRPKDSIQSYPINGPYEILAGHNRVRAAKELGWSTIKAHIVRVDDVQAVRIINDSNLQRGDVSELEKAWAYRQLFEAMNRNGRNQYSAPETPLIGQEILDAEDEAGEDCITERQSSNDEDGGLCITERQGSAPKRTTQIIGEMYGINQNTISRKIRLTYLTDELYRLYQKKDISQSMAVNLSYLEEDIQRLLLELRKKYRFTLTQQNCEALRKDYNSWKRSGTENQYAPQRLLQIMQTEKPELLVREVKPKRYTVEETLFPAGLRPGDREEYVARALRYVLEHEVKL